MSYPVASVADARRAKALVRTVGAALRRHGMPTLDEADRGWLEDRPQSLFPLLDAAVAAGAASRRDDAVIAAAHWLIGNQLELIRFRLDAGHDWARAMLVAYQEKLVALAGADGLPLDDWGALVNVLRDAKVPIEPEMAAAFADAFADATPDAAPSLEDVSGQLRGLLDQLGQLGNDPFEVVEALAQTGALMPAEVRAFLTHELGRSAHAVLREAVPLLLLDAEPAIRQAAAAVLEQVAAAETFSPVMLRRVLLVRNWVPESDRPAVDRLVRKARVKGVECAQWPAAAATPTIHASTIDGSGAQSLILAAPSGRTGLFAGLLLKQGFGVRDAWCDMEASRREITGMLKEIRKQMPSHVVGRDHLDVMVQHAIACGVAAGQLPLAAVIAIAEAVGAADWKDRALDVPAEIARRFADLEPALRAPAAIDASLRRSGIWLAMDATVESWFEDNAAIRPLVKGRGRPKPDVAAARVLEDVLPGRRDVWAERLLLQGLWMQAGADRGGAAQDWQDCVILAHELLSGRPLAQLPAMVVIAERSILVGRAGAW